MLIDTYSGSRIKTCDHCRTNWTISATCDDIQFPPGGITNIKSIEGMCPECIERRAKFIRRYIKPSLWSSFGIAKEVSDARADNEDNKD